MKKYFLLALLFSCFVGFSACDDDDSEMTMDMMPDYQASIIAPNADDKKVGDKINIEVVFEDKNGGTVHHAKVRIVNEADGTEIYNAPDAAHVHETSGKYTFTDELTLDVNGHSDWMLIAKVWGHDAGAHELSDTLHFHVHPQ